ncbi:MAG TPA: hypothetical protein DDW65_17120 [Firmicutes bacterium]|nr:hypothetical protein [Bacillota bacterium]
MGGKPNDKKVIYYGHTCFLWNSCIASPYKKYSDDELIAVGLFAKRMFKDRIDGACTASATYMIAVLRSIGIPARIIETNSLLDYGDSRQVGLLKKLKNVNLQKALKAQTDSYYGHYYIEAYVGGRWIKINNNGKIMESNYIPSYPGIFHIKADTFFDYSDTAMVDVFKKYTSHYRPYKLLALSDSYGKYYVDENPLFKASKIYGVDISKAKGIYLFGPKDFCENQTSEFNDGIVKYRASLNHIDLSILNDANLVVISADNPFGSLPSVIKEKIQEKNTTVWG